MTGEAAGRNAVNNSTLGVDNDPKTLIPLSVIPRHKPSAKLYPLAVTLISGVHEAFHTFQSLLHSSEKR